MHRTTKLAASALILALTLSACGGGNDDNSSPSSASSAASSSATSSAAASSAAASSAAASSAAASSAAASSAAASSAAASSAAASSAAASSAAASSAAASSAAAAKVVLQANFQTVPTGLTDGTETTITSTPLPTTLNSQNYSINVVGKLKMVTTQAIPSVAATGAADLSTWSTGVVQFSNNTASVGKVTIAAVKCPFTLKVNHAPANTSEATRQLRVTFGGTQVYLDGGAANGAAPGYTASIDSATASTPCKTGTTDVEVYGWDGTQGKGVRVYDLSITQ